MNRKEVKELGLSLATLVKEIINKENNAENIANTSIAFLVDTLKTNSSLFEEVDYILDDQDWDNMILWQRFKKDFKVLEL